jgi:glyoxylase-like metal-dependent hydrolase (beta-lactamase superfamily II)
VTAEQLAASHDMVPVQGSVDIDVPADVLGPAFFQASHWPWWNACMAWVRNRQLRLGDHLIWVFEPIRPWYLYRFPAIATIVELEAERKVTWEVTALPGFYARHTYSIADLGGGRSRFSSWEQGMGPSFRATRAFWLAHFEFVKNRSLQGARLLEAAYRIHGHLDEAAIPRRRGTLRSLTDLWGLFELLRLKTIQLEPNLWTMLGGGGNTVVVEAGDQSLVVDPKFPPFDRPLRRWIGRQLRAPIRTVVNTHHHYDHTFGNPGFAPATIVADARVPELMRRRDPRFWQSHPDGLPDPAHLVSSDTTLEVGGRSVGVHPVPRAHTAGDAWIRITGGEGDYVVTGDIGSFGHYPFLDRGEGGADLAGWARAARQMVETAPNAKVVPGHGPVGKAEDLRRLAVFLEFLDRSVQDSAATGLGEAATVRNVDLSSWRLAALPVFRYGEVVVTGRTAVRRAFQLQAARKATPEAP